MTVELSARRQRASGRSFAEIAASLGVGLKWVYKCAGDVVPDPRPTKNTVINYAPDSDGYLRPVRMPRIALIHGAAA